MYGGNASLSYRASHVAGVDACAMAYNYLWRALTFGGGLSSNYAMSGKKRRKSRGRYVFDLPILFINISLHIIRILRGYIDLGLHKNL